MSDPDWPALFRSMQEQLGMLQAEFIQLKDTSVSKASLHDVTGRTESVLPVPAGPSGQ